jgi:MFS family permease
MRKNEIVKESKWSWSLRFFLLGVCLLLVAGLHYWFAGKFLAPEYRGGIITYWQVAIGGFFVLFSFLIRYFGRNKDGESHWKWKLFFLGLLCFVVGIGLAATGQVPDLVIVGLVGLGALFIAIPKIRSGKGMGFDSVTGRKRPPTIVGHVRENPKSAFTPSGTTEDPDGPARMRGDR